MTDEPRVFEEAEAATPSPTLRLRHDQMFPVLTPQEIERLRRFGSVRRYRDREPLFRTGDLDAACLSSSAATWRSPSATVSATSRPSSIKVLANSWPRSGRCPDAPPWSTATPKATSRRSVIEPEALRRLLVAEAELGERIVRALILRRVGLIDDRR